MNLLDDDDVRWKHYTAEPQFGHPVSFSGALLDGRDDGHADLLYRFDPNSACHLHRHTCAVSSLVLEGELTVVDIDPDSGNEVGRVVKPAGTWVHKLPGDTHIEIGGPEGALVLFNLYTDAADGSLVETLSADGRVLDHQTMEPILRSMARRRARASQDG